MSDRRWSHHDHINAILECAVIEEHRRKRARRHAWYTAFGITLLLCVVTGIAYLATDSVFLKVAVCLVRGGC